MPLTRAVDEESNVPADAAVYHFMAVPVAAKLATVGDAEAQNVCEAVPVGTAGGAQIIFTV